MKTKGEFFVDEFGRKIIFHGVNLSGSSKLPMNFTTHDTNNFYNHKAVSFVGRPFPLEEADEHFDRLKSWGFNFLRLLVTWEAVEHEGPGIYDEDYLEYLHKIVKIADKYGFSLFIDPHQDVWGRYSGGDGAPGWTYEVAGFDISKFSETGAAIVQNTHKGDFPKMIWPTNYSKLVASTMFTLFFGGEDFAPKFKVDGINIGVYLQEHYINAMKRVAIKLKDCSNVIGFDTLNEPSAGYIGKDFDNFEILVSKGHSPDVLQGMALGSGIPQNVKILDRGKFGTKEIGTEILNRNSVSVWKEGYSCIWKEHDVWSQDSVGNPVVNNLEYFKKINGHTVNFPEDYMKPFVHKYTNALRSVNKELLILFEHNLENKPPKWRKGELKDFVYAPHWYDGMTLFLKQFTPYLTFDRVNSKLIFGKKNVKNHFKQALKDIKSRTGEYLGDYPTVIGEIGIPFDLNKKKAYKTGNFKSQIQALDANLTALDENLLHFTLWNYTPGNTNEWGDLWNNEDLSIFSRDQQTDINDINSGGRALEALIRPYAMKTSGEPIEMSFDYKKKIFNYSFKHDKNCKAATEIFIPNFHYSDSISVNAPDGKYHIDKEKQLLFYYSNSTSDIDCIKISI